MNFKYLFTAALAISSLAMSADTLNFGYCTDEHTGVGHNSPDVYMAAAIRVPAEVAQEFAGNSISAVSIGFGASTPKRVTLFLTYDLAEEPFYTQMANLKVNRFNDVPLTTPYEFESRDVYVGYKIKTTTASDFPIGFDKLAMSYSEDGDWYASTLEEDNLNNTWRHVGPEMGNAAIRLIVEGDNLAQWQYRADPIAMQVPAYALPGKEFEITMSLQNNGVQDINSVEVEVSSPDKTVTKTITFDSPVLSGKCKIFDVAGISTNVSGDNVPITATVKKVNGQANQSTRDPLSSGVLCSANLAKRPLIIEEGTGTWCGWCIRGYVALETMREKYTDGSYIGIAVHNKSSRSDPMHCTSYQSFINRYVNGFPKALANRMSSFSALPVEAQSLYDQITVLPAKVIMDVNAEISETDPNKAKVTVTAHSLKGISSHSYGVAIVLTEDNVGPYTQENYYSGGGSGSMGGFESKGAKVSLMFNDVARDIFDWEGNTSAFPSSLEPETPYTYQKEVSLANVGNKDNAHVIALLIDTTNGQIETGVSRKLVRGPESGIATEEVAKQWNVSGSNGALLVEGNDVDSFKVYSMAGSLCAQLEGPGEVSLPSGIYVVAVNCGSETYTAKVAL